VHAKYAFKQEQHKSLKTMRKEMKQEMMFADWNDVKKTQTIYKTLRTISPNLCGLESQQKVHRNEETEDIQWSAEIFKHPDSFESHVKALWFLISVDKQVDALKLLEVIKSKVSKGIIKI
jgi:hypothetical protein